MHAESASQLPMPTSYVQDFAGVIDAGSKQQMEQLGREVWLQAHAKIIVVTIHSLDGVTIEEFATDLEDKWKVGAKGTDRGILMILAINDRKRRIEVGYGLEGILNDAKVGDIGRSMVPQLRQSQYGPAIVGGLQQIADVISKDAGVTLTPPSTEQQEDQPAYHHQPERRHGSNIFGILRIIILVVIFISIFSGRGRGGGGWLWFLLGNMLGGGGGGGRGRDDGWGGGGGGGGGGGFGGFGGGSSGGGGASGDW